MAFDLDRTVNAVTSEASERKGGVIKTSVSTATCDCNCPIHTLSLDV